MRVIRVFVIVARELFLLVRMTNNVLRAVPWANSIRPQLFFGLMWRATCIYVRTYLKA